ncbi:hypothetical protein ACFSKU_08725 [Pontibacter silvestris]|uniref:Uncharacterized protein n=1 Tax=Pontibacter silvestris TaxID=2305183 RepID=A0ABW4WY84_9BACT|nr:hypothetical protein [Pontibacter silvestris]
MTRIDHNGATYFTYGFYEENNIPDDYIQPIYSGINSGFEVILFWERDTAVIYAHYGRFDRSGKHPKLALRIYEGVGNDPLFYKMKKDSTGNYKVLHD